MRKIKLAAAALSLLFLLCTSAAAQVTTRAVSGTLRHPDGSPWAGAVVKFELTGATFSASSQFPAGAVTATTDAQGHFTITLWTNSEGLLPSVKYKFTRPDGSTAYFNLTPGDPVDISTVLASTVTPTDTNRNSLLALVDAHAAVIAGSNRLGHVECCGPGLSIDGNGLISNSAAGVLAHSQLTGLGADDHPQYFNRQRGDARYAQLGHTHTLAQITDAGTAASRNVPASGNAASGEVVTGSDTRLSDARTPTAHIHPFTDITGAATNAQLPSTISSKTFDNTNTASFKGSLFTLQDATDTTKQARFDLSNISPGQTRSVNVPDANSTTAQAKSATSHQFLTAMSAQGLFSSAQPSSGDISDFNSAASAAAPVQSVAGRTGVVSLTTTDVAEGSNLYFTNARADARITSSAVTTALGFTPENVANKSTSTALGTSDTLYPSQNAVKSYVDNGLALKAPLASPAFTGTPSAPSFTLTGDLTLSGTLSPAQLAGDVNDYSPAGLSSALALRVDGGAADRNITGLAGGADGRIITVTNVGSTNSLVLKSQSASSTAANRFLMPADVTLPPDTALALRYDGTTQRWRPWSRALANTGVAAGTYSKVTVDVAGRVTAGASLASGDVTAALGFTPLNPTNNLSDLNSASTARTNLGLGSFALKNSLLATDLPGTLNASAFGGNVTINPSGTATSGTQYPSYDLIFQDSGWNTTTTSANTLTHTFRLIPGSGATGAIPNRLALLNNAGTEYVSFDGVNQRVGIGATAPDSALTVAGAAARLRISPSTPASQAATLSLFRSGITDWTITHDASNNLNFARDGVSNLFISSAGLVGINKSSSIGAQLHVIAKDSSTKGIRVQLAASPSATSYPFSVADSTDATLAYVSTGGTLVGHRATYTGVVGTTTLNLANGNTQVFSFGAGNETIALSNIPDSAIITVHVIQDATGSRVVTWPASIKWVGGTAPTLSTGASKRDIFVFNCDGTSCFEVSRALDVR